jgi:hypothetical protein
MVVFYKMGGGGATWHRECCGANRPNQKKNKKNQKVWCIQKKHINL